MLTIGRLRLQLPDGYAHRAAAIARHVGDELARRPVTANAHVERLRLPPLEIPQGASNRQIAAQIAGQIHRQVHHQSRGAS